MFWLGLKHTYVLVLFVFVRSFCLYFFTLNFLRKYLCSDERGQFHNQNSSCYIEQMLWWYQVPEIDNFEDMEPRSEKGTVKVSMVTIIKMQMQKFKILAIFGLMCIRSFLITKLIRRIIFIKILRIVGTFIIFFIISFEQRLYNKVIYITK